MRREASTVVIGAIAMATYLAAACNGGDAVPKGPDVDAGWTPLEGGFGATECSACLDAACASALSACAREPGCATWMSCRRACAADAGNVDPACVAGCPVPRESAAIEAKDRYERCSVESTPVPCASCGVDPEAPSSVLAQECSKSTSQEPCVRCLQNNCCGTNARCLSDADCKALDDCIEDCPSSGNCMEQCLLQYPHRIQRWGRYTACRLVRCSGPDSCELTDDSTLLCLFEQCGAPLAECNSDAECVLYDKCTSGCDDDSCKVSCAQRYPAGKRRYDPYSACLLLRCLAK